MPFTKKKKQWTRLFPQFCEIKFSDVFFCVRYYSRSKYGQYIQHFSDLHHQISDLGPEFIRAISDFVIDRKEIDSIRNVLGCYSFMTHVDSNLPSKNSSAPQKTLRNSLVSTMALFCFWFGILFLHKTLWK